ncbi:MAG: DUF3421 domain-containing protein, partial [Anaerolineae bacterium]|nr:DUF3421 domain-containing protein [Anaerolineae bacterium]
MNPVFEALQRRYQDLMARSGTPSPGDEFWESIRLFLEDARQAGRVLTDPGERALLRAYMRFLAVLLHEHGETPPPIELLPPDRARWAEAPPARRAEGGFPAWFWGLVGAAAMAVIAGLADGQPLAVCRAGFRGGVHPGKVVAGHCNIGWGGKEESVKPYE